MAGKASLADQQKQVQENVHSQITNFCKHMDYILQPDLTGKDKQGTSSSENNSSPRRSGLSFATSRTAPLKDHRGKNLKLNFHSIFQVCCFSKICVEVSRVPNFSIHVGNSLLS